MSKEKLEVDVILFGLSNVDMRMEYPELEEMPEFKSLQPKQLRLCWLLGNRTSPIYGLSKVERLHKALEVIYGASYADNEDIAPYLKGDMPDDLRLAVARMELFNPEFRLKAKLLSQYMLENLYSMIALSEVQMKAMDIDEKKKYTDLVLKIHDAMPDMVKRIEEAYGVKMIERKSKKKALVNISDVLR